MALRQRVRGPVRRHDRFGQRHPCPHHGRSGHRFRCAGSSPGERVALDLRSRRFKSTARTAVHAEILAAAPPSLDHAGLLAAAGGADPHRPDPVGRADADGQRQDRADGGGAGRNSGEARSSRTGALARRAVLCGRRSRSAEHRGATRPTSTSPPTRASPRRDRSRPDAQRAPPPRDLPARSALAGDGVDHRDAGADRARSADGLAAPAHIRSPAGIRARRGCCCRW